MTVSGLSANMVAHHMRRSEPSEAILLDPAADVLMLPNRNVGHVNILDSFCPYQGVTSESSINPVTVDHQSGLSLTSSSTNANQSVSTLSMSSCRALAGPITDEVRIQ